MEVPKHHFTPLQTAIMEFTKGEPKTLGQITDHLWRRNASYVVDTFDGLVKQGWLLDISRPSRIDDPPVYRRRNMDLTPAYTWRWDDNPEYPNTLLGEHEHDRLIYHVFDPASANRPIDHLREAWRSWSNGTYIYATYGDEIELCRLYEERFGLPGGAK